MACIRAMYTCHVYGMAGAFTRRRAPRPALHGCAVADGGSPLFLGHGRLLPGRQQGPAQLHPGHSVPLWPVERGRAGIPARPDIRGLHNHWQFKGREHHGRIRLS